MAFLFHTQNCSFMASFYRAPVEMSLPSKFSEKILPVAQLVEFLASVLVFIVHSCPGDLTDFDNRYPQYHAVSLYLRASQ